MSSDTVSPTPSAEPNVEEIRARAEASPQGAWLIWSPEHQAWWRTKKAGYCTDIMGAGTYTEATARHIVNSCPPEKAKSVKLMAEIQGLAAGGGEGTVAALFASVLSSLAEARRERDELRDMDALTAEEAEALMEFVLEARRRGVSNVFPKGTFAKLRRIAAGTPEKEEGKNE